METINTYMPFILTTIITIFILGTAMFSLFMWSERSRKKDDEKATSFQRHMRIENGLGRKETRRILDEIQKTNRELKQFNKDNAIYLHRIFEIVDHPEDEKG